MPSNKVAGSFGSFIFSFLGNLILFCIVAVSACIPTSGTFPLVVPVVQGSHFFTSSPALIVDFDDGHSDWFEVIPHSFDLHFSCKSGKNTQNNYTKNILITWITKMV